jgi:hypothetical protein
MAEETKENTDIIPGEKRKLYVAQISFLQPDSGPIQVPARDEEHARELIHKMLAHLRDLKIHDIFEHDKMDRPMPSEAPPGSTTPTEKVIH